MQTVSSVKNTLKKALFEKNYSIFQEAAENLRTLACCGHHAAVQAYASLYKALNPACEHIMCDYNDYDELIAAHCRITPQLFHRYCECHCHDQ